MNTLVWIRPGVSARGVFPARVAIAMVVVVFGLALVFVSGAGAASYTAGSPLSVGGKFASGVAVNQSTHNVYVASCGQEEEEKKGCSFGVGGFAEFNSTGVELACSLEGSPTRPAGVAVDPETGDIDVLSLSSSSGVAQVLVYGEACGARKSEFSVAGLSPTTQVPQAATDGVGTIYLPNPSPIGKKLLECTPQGVCAEPLTGLTRPISASFDATGDLYLTSNLALCTNVSAGKLVVYKPNGAGGFVEVGAFAGLNGATEHGEVSTVAVDKKTGQVFVGRGCGSTFRVERYRAGGSKLEEFGSGLFLTGPTLAYNQLAVDETSGTVYATDSGHGEAQVFKYSGAALVPMGKSVVGEGSVVCEVEGHEEPCASEYETGTTITVKASSAAHSRFVKWSETSGSAAACKNQTATMCTFTISASSAVQAEFVSIPKRSVQVTVTGAGSITATATSPVAASGGISGCSSSGGSCSAEYYEGEEPEIEETAEPDSHFAAWSVTGAESTSCTGVVSPCKLKLGASNAAVSSEFKLNGFALSIEKTGVGTVSVTSVQSGLGLESIVCGAHCSELFSPSSMVELAVTPQTGGQFAGWSTIEGNPGTCTGTTNPCVVTIEEAVKLQAEGALEGESLTVNETGPGSVSVQCDEGHGYETCTSPLSAIPYGTKVKATAIPNTGAELVSLVGTGSAASACSGDTCVFDIKQTSSVTAGFKLIAHPASLTVFKGGNGTGTVTSLAPHTGISCGASCEENIVSYEEGQTIELQESPQPGSVFAGWLGCRRVSATTCQVKLGSSEVEVTAVFLLEGKEGATGKEGPAGKEGATGPAGLTGKEGATGKEGPIGATGKEGLTGATGKEGPVGATGKEGAKGATGKEGPVGKEGKQGSTGPQGLTGAVGTQGEHGLVGVQGAVGPAGPTGPKGETGSAGKVTCIVKQHGKKIKVTCTVKYASSSARASVSRRSLRWVLLHAGRVVVHGKSGHAPRIDLGELRRGTYTLYLQGQSKGTVIHVH